EGDARERDGQPEPLEDDESVREPGPQQQRPVGRERDCGPVPGQHRPLDLGTAIAFVGANAHRVEITSAMAAMDTTTIPTAIAKGRRSGGSGWSRRIACSVAAQRR